MSGNRTEEALFRTYVVPFLLFLGFNLLLWGVEGSYKWEHPTAPWYQQMPELWVYALQVLVCGAYLIVVRKGAEWDFAVKPCLLGALCGVVGIGLWLVPYVAGWIPAEGGFTPEKVLGQGSAATCAAYALRFARAAVIVPFAEEWFWRGYLMRWCINRDFPQRVPLGQASWLSFATVTAAFMLVHHVNDWAGAFIYGSLAFGLVMHTRRLTPVVVMHAVANFIMGLVAVTCDLPRLW